MYLLKDIIFKTMFKEYEEFRKYISDILKYYFDIDLNEYELSSEEIPLEHVEDHQNRVDLFLKSKKNISVINIEANIGDKKDYYVNRNLVYMCKIVIWLYKDSKEYKEDAKVIQVNINDIKCPFDEEIVATTTMLYDVENKNKDERMVIHNLYLGKFKKLTYNKLNEIEKDLKFLICDDIDELEELSKGSEKRVMIMEKFRKLTKEEFFWALFDPEEDRIMCENTEKKIAREKGLEEGMKEGSMQANINVVKNALKMNMSIEDISKLTKLSKDEIKNIKANI